MSFRDNLQYLRAERNMTQEQLAMLLGVSRQSVTKWEAERSYPEMDKLLKMCQIFDCSLDDLVQGDLTKRHDETGNAQTHTRTVFSRGLIGGIAAIFVGIGIFLTLDESAESYALFFLILFIALGVWSIVHYSMLLGRTYVAEYNRSASDDLEIEEIMSAQIREEVRDSLLQKKKHGKKLGAVCGAIMLVATIVGLALMFVPVFASPDPSNFQPEGTSAMWFWVAWPLGGMICGIVALIWEAFGKEDH